jgi:hypothetical protein
MYHNLTKSSTTVLTAIALTVVLAVSAAFILSRTATAQVPPTPAAPGSSLDQRVAQRKAERNVVIVQKDQQRLVGVCVAAQSKVRTLQGQTTPVVANHVKTNQQIDAKLWIMIGKLKIAEKDTFVLEKQRAALADKFSAFQQTGQNYNQTLDDIVAVNCRADLVGFKALLDTARIYRTQLRDQSTDIRNYLNNEVKPTLSALASELQGKPSTEQGR